MNHFGNIEILREIRERDSSPILLFSEHAGNAVPAKLSRLGLSDEHFERHYAIDIGVADFSRAFCKLSGAGAVLAMCSRLVVDINRSLGDADMFPTMRDGYPIPGNQNLKDEDRDWRIENLYDPYDQRVQARIGEIKEQGQTPLMVSVHSFTRNFNGNIRTCDIGVVFDEAWPEQMVNFARYVYGDLKKLPELDIQINQPYNLSHFPGSSCHRNVARRHPECLLVQFEICNDLIDTPEKAAVMAKKLKEALDGRIQ